MQIVRSLAELKAAITEIKSLGHSMGFVPTMGALHAGHLSLVQASKARCQKTVVSVFVNPMQFGPNEDLDRYPRPLQKDLDLCLEAGVDVVFVPSVELMYPKDFSFKLTESHYSNVLCGAHRPGYFDGICTVVMKLLHLLPCDQLFMGLKDVEQVKVIEQMIKAFHLPVELVPCETIREESGLALSSRNQYLSKEEKIIAAEIQQALQKAQAMVLCGERQAGVVLDEAHGHLKKYPEIKLQYLELLHWDDFLRPEKIMRACVIAIAAHVGKTRLIDNLIVDVLPESG